MVVALLRLLLLVLPSTSALVIMMMLRACIEVAGSQGSTNEGGSSVTSYIEVEEQSCSLPRPPEVAPVGYCQDEGRAGETDPIKLGERVLDIVMRPLGFAFCDAGAEKRGQAYCTRRDQRRCRLEGKTL